MSRQIVIEGFDVPGDRQYGNIRIRSRNCDSTNHDKRSNSRKGAKIAKMDENSIGKTYLKLTGMKLGYLLTFGEDMMKRGITRTVNGLPE